MVVEFDRRADLLDAVRVLEEAALDKYGFIRDSYLQRRRSLVYDGEPPKEGDSVKAGSPRDPNVPVASEEAVVDALRAVYDPEIPVNIVDLGLVYQCSVKPNHEQGGNDVHIQMTLTAPGCGMGPVIAADAKAKLEALPGVEAATVEIVWDPIWNPRMISEAGRKQLGLE